MWVKKKDDIHFYSGSCVYCIQQNYQSWHIFLSVFWIDHISLVVLKCMLQEFSGCLCLFSFLYFFFILLLFLLPFLSLSFFLTLKGVAGKHSCHTLYTALFSGILQADANRAYGCVTHIFGFN